MSAPIRVYYDCGRRLAPVILWLDGEPTGTNRTGRCQRRNSGYPLSLAAIVLSKLALCKGNRGDNLWLPYRWSPITRTVYMVLVWQMWCDFGGPVKPLMINVCLLKSKCPSWFLSVVCEQDVQRVCASCSEEHLHPFKENMESFILNGRFGQCTVHNRWRESFILNGKFGQCTVHNRWRESFILNGKHSRCRTLSTQC